MSARWLKKWFPVVNAIFCTDGLKIRLFFSKKGEFRHKFREDEQISLNKIIFSQNAYNVSARWLQILFPVVSVILRTGGLKIQYFISKKGEFRHKFRGEQIFLHKIIFSQNISNVSARWLKKLFLLSTQYCVRRIEDSIIFFKKWDFRHKFTEGEQILLHKIIFLQNTSHVSARLLKKLFPFVSAIFCTDGLKIQYFISKKGEFRHKFRKGEQISLNKIIFSQNTSNVSARWLKKWFPVVNAIFCTDGLKIRLFFSKKGEFRHKFREDEQISLNKIIFSQNAYNVSARWLQILFPVVSVILRTGGLKIQYFISKKGEFRHKFRGEQIFLHKIIFSQNISNVSARWLKKLFLLSTQYCVRRIEDSIIFFKKWDFRHKFTEGEQILLHKIIFSQNISNVSAR